MVFVDTPVSDNYIDESFGWEYFTLASKDTKKLYAAAALLDAIPYSTMDTIKRLLVKEWTGVDITEFEDSFGYHTLTIDHQSRPLIPCDYDGNISQLPTNKFVGLSVR